MTILLTGSNGFVGKFIQKQEICCSLISDNGLVDLRSQDLVIEAVANVNPDAVIHLAAQSYIPESFTDPKYTYDVNFFGTFNILTALKQNNFKGRFLYVGSGDVYGLVPPDLLPINENLPPKPRSPYAVSKVAAEALCYQWSQTEGFDVIMTRPFNHIGPGQDEQFVISGFAKQIIDIKQGNRKPIIDVGDIDVSRDFTDVRDIVTAYLSLLNDGHSGETYNVCSGQERTVRSILDQMLSLSNIKAQIKQDASRLRPSEQRRVKGDYSKLHKDTGWSPQIPLNKTLSDILNFWENGCYE